MTPSLVQVLARGALAFILAVAVAGSSAARQLVFTIDQRYGTIGFSVEHLGLFSSQGQFDRFTGKLDVDPSHPERTSFEIRIDTTSIDMPWQPAAAMLRAQDFFDAARYPVMSYDSTAVTPMPGRQYAISGVLKIRGVARPQALDALLLKRQIDTRRHIETAEFAVTGRLKRSEFGMVTNQVFISDTVRLNIHVRIELPLPADG
jgi:polyisoprenoid-binding protein YceI